MGDSVVAGGPNIILQSWNFRVEVSEFGEARFSEVGGFGEWESDVVETNHGGEDQADKDPGKIKYAPLVLKHPDSADLRFVEWADSCKAGAGTPGVPKRNVDVIQMDRDGNDVRRKRYKLGWISKVSHGSLTAGSTESSMVELTMQHQGWSDVP